MTSFPIFSCLLFSFWPVGRTVAHWSSISSFEQLLWFFCTVGAFLEPVLVCVWFTHFVIIYQSKEENKSPPPLCPSTVRMNMWVRGFHYYLPVFKAHTLVGWPFSGLLCKMWRQWQPFAASSSPHRVWPALQCSPSHVSFLLFSRIRCQTLHRYSHTVQEVGVKGFYFFNSGFSFFFSSTVFS